MLARRVPPACSWPGSTESPYQSKRSVQARLNAGGGSTFFSRPPGVAAFHSFIRRLPATKNYHVVLSTREEDNRKQSFVTRWTLQKCP